MQVVRCFLRRLVVAAEGIGQSRVGMAGRVGIREPAELGDVRPDLLAAERAVHADDQRAGVAHRVPERLDRLAGQGTAAQVDDRDREPERKAGSRLVRRLDGRLRVQRVEDGLDQQQVHAALGERGDLFRVGLLHLVEGDGPVRRVVDLRAERQGDVQRADRSRDVPAALGRSLVNIFGRRGHIRLDIGVMIPGAMIKLDETDPALGQPASQQTI